MRFLINRWRQVGTRLYLALVFAVALTLLSSAVGIYYFERSGDLSYRIRSESAPAVDAAWASALSAEKLRSYGREIIAGSGSAPTAAPPLGRVGGLLLKLEIRWPVLRWRKWSSSRWPSRTPRMEWPA